jgi:DNA-binding transcriptional regulator YhcF (GntR family)
MKRINLFTLLVGAVALTFAANAYAQSEDSEETVDPVETPAFVDVDGDGINDATQRRHVVRNRALAQAHIRQQAREMNTIREQLNDQQRAELDELVTALRAEGKNREEIHATVTTKLGELGVNLPETWNATPREFVGGNRLSETQRTELQSMIAGLRESGATNEQVRAAISAKFNEWGVASQAMGPNNGKGGPREPRRSGGRN